MDLVDPDDAGLDPLRERVRIGGGEPIVWREIVGVVGDVRQVSLDEGDVNAVYVPQSQWTFTDYQRSLVVRSSATMHDSRSGRRQPL